MKNKKKLWTLVIISVIGILLVVGLVLCIKYTSKNNRNATDNDSKTKESENVYLTSKYDLIDYRLNSCFEEKDEIICLADNYINDNREDLIIKIGNDNRILWKQTIYNDNTFGSILSCNSDGLCVLATADKYTSQGLMSLIDSQGNIKWNIKTDEYGLFNFSDAKITDNSIVVVGTSRKNNSNVTNDFVFKYDLNGNVLWEMEYNGYLGSVTISNDGYVYASGYNYSSKSSIDNNRGSLIKIDNNGKLVWEKTYKDDQIMSSYTDILINSDDNIIVLGEKQKATNILDNQILMLNYNNEGQEINEHIYTDDVIDKILLNKQKDIIAFGEKTENTYANEEKQIALFKIDNNFNIIAKKLLDITKFESIIDVVETENEYVIIALTKESDDKTAIMRFQKDELFE